MLLAQQQTTAALMIIQFAVFSLGSSARSESLLGLNALRLFGSANGSRTASQQFYQVSSEANVSGRFAVTKSSCPAQMFEVVHQCYRSYLRAYKIDIGSSGKLPPIGVYSKAVGNTEHVDSLCRQYDSLHNCIQSNDVQTSTLECMNLKMFEALTLRYEDAIHYMINYAAYEFACSEGYKVFSANEQCFKVTLTSKTVEKELLRCKLILIQDDPIGTCHSYKKDAHCTSEVFGEACGRVVGRAMCELMVHLGHYLAGVERSCLHVLNAECSRYSSAAHSTTCLISVQILFILMTILWQFQTIGV